MKKMSTEYLFCIAQHDLLELHIMNMFLHLYLLSRMRSSSTFYAHNPALEIVDRQKNVNVYLHIHVPLECSAEEPFMCSILCH